jgi:hypothetical protein
MPRTVFVSVFPCNWHTSLLTFKQRVHRLQDLCKKPVPTVAGDNNPLHVVIAPEYTFRENPAAVVRDKSLTYHNKEKSNPGVFEHYKNSKLATTILSAFDRQFLISALSIATQRRNVLVVPGTIFWAQSEPQYKISTFKKIRSVRAPGVARNTCDVIYRGNLIHSYNKHLDAHELDNFEMNTYTFMPGINAGTFEASGLKIGVEVCKDAGSRTLQTALFDRENPHATTNQLQRPAENMNFGDVGLDLQLLVSDGAKFLPSMMAIRKGGFAAHCDASGGEVAFTRNPEGAIKPVAKTGEFFVFPYGVSDSFANAREALKQKLHV